MMEFECKIKPKSESCTATVLELYTDGRANGQPRSKKGDCSIIDTYSLGVARSDAINKAKASLDDFPRINMEAYTHSYNSYGTFKLDPEHKSSILILGRKIGERVISGEVTYRSVVKCWFKSEEEERSVDLPHMSAVDFVLASAF